MSYNSATGQNRHRFVSRERAYHGVNIGGVSYLEWLITEEPFP